MVDASFRLFLLCGLLLSMARADGSITTASRRYASGHEKPAPGVGCALRHGLLCGLCLSSKDYMDCQSLLFGSKKATHVPGWAEADPVRYVKSVGVAETRVTTCAGFVSFLVRDAVCTSPMTREHFVAEGFAREAALHFEPKGGQLYSVKDMIVWMPPSEGTVRALNDVPAAAAAAVPVSARQRGATQSERQRFVTNIKFTNPRVVQGQWNSMIRGVYGGSCPRPRVKTTRRGSGWQTRVNC